MGARALAWVFLDVPPEAQEKTTRFWAEVLGEEAVLDADDDAYRFFPTPMPVRVAVQRIGAADSPRVHLDVVADDVEAEARRLQDLGATLVQTFAEHVILADPAGLLVCVVPSKWAADAPLPVRPQASLTDRSGAGGE